MPTCSCPCGKKYRVAEAAIGKKAKCKKCGEVFVLEEEDSLFQFADEDFAPSSGTPTTPPGETGPDSDDPRQMASDDIPPPTGAYRSHGGSALADDVGRPKGFGQSLLWTFLFPTSPNNLIGFAVVWAILFIGLLCASWALIFGAIISFLIIGWYAAFRFAVIESAAAGEEDLPQAWNLGGILDDIIVPAIKWLGSVIVVLLPLIAYLIISASIGSTGAADALQEFADGEGTLWQVAGQHVALVACVLLAFFMWPMVVLCVALGGFQSLYRLDLIVWTIIRTLPVYLLTVGLVFSAGLLGQLLGDSVGGGVLEFLAVGISLYFDIVAMRVIGLYYHHFKHRFAWDWG